MSLRPPNPKKITLDDLEPGDVILSRGDSHLDKLITTLDQGDYSHASLWDGNEVYEATMKGILHQTIDVDLNEQSLVDAYRFQSNGRRLGDPGWPPRPIFDEADTYVGSAYGYTSLILLGVVLCFCQLPKEHVWKEAARILGGLAATALKELLEKLLDSETRPMICTEVVASAYYEAKTSPANRYGVQILIDGSRSALSTPQPAFLHNTLLLEHTAPGAPGAASDFEVLQRSCREHLLGVHPELRTAGPQQFELALHTADAQAAGAGLVVVAGGPALSAGLITPRDMERSPSLQFVGCLKDAR